MTYSVAPRRPTLRAPACRRSSDSTAFVRERAPCPSPRLAMEDTACRIDSMETGSFPSSGADSPNSSHRMFGFLAGVRFRFFACMPLRNAVLFMAISPWVIRVRRPPRRCAYRVNRRLRANADGLSPGKAAHAGETKTIRARTVTGRKARDVPLVRSVGHSTTRGDRSPIPRTWAEISGCAHPAAPTKRALVG